MLAPACGALVRITYILGLFQAVSDIVTLRSSADGIILEDWSGNLEGTPERDESNDAYSGAIVADDTGNFLTFSRLLSTGDANDLDLLGCNYFVLAQGNVINGQVTFPYINKFVYPEPICISQCGK